MCQETPPVTVTLQQGHGAPREARALISRQWCLVHHTSVRDDAALLISELVTNAVLHGRPPITVKIDCDPGTGVQVWVSDGSPATPKVQALSATSGGGRGMALVSLLSDAWGTEFDADGKHVWFRLKDASAAS